MRTIHSILFGTLLATAAGGCSGSSFSEHVGSSAAQLSLAVRGRESASLKVTATDDVGGAVVLDRTLEVTAASPVVVDLALAPSTYTFHVDAFADGSQQSLLGSGTAEADLKGGLTTDVMLIASIGAGNSAQFQSQVNIAPQITGIAVQAVPNGSADGSTSGTVAQVHVDAVDPQGGALTYFWSGFGIDGAVQGSSTMALSTAATASFTGAPLVHVVVQDSAGATTEGSVAVNITGGLAASGATATATGLADADASVSLSGNAGEGASEDAGLSVSAAGNVTASTDAGASGSTSTGGSSQSCSDANAQCTAACAVGLMTAATGVTLDSSCLAQCSLALAACVQ